MKKCVFKRGATKKHTLKTIPKSVGGGNQNNAFKLIKKHKLCCRYLQTFRAKLQTYRKNKSDRK